ncbi:FAD-dependent monooxygenase asL4 [Fulvia fulva]|nr:FAD-dependent monooxygenase asL4 [Fulvia fulva]
MARLRVLIVGASIAGPAAAYWLTKAGAEVTIIERFPALRSEGGQAVDIRTAGVTVMRKIPGMEAAVRAHRAPIEGIAFVDSKGQSYGTIGATGSSEQQGLVSEYEIFRGDLSRILFDLTRDHPRVKYVFGTQISALRQNEDDGTVDVTFTSTLPPSTYDLVVDCSGATSRTRALALNCGVRDHVHPAHSWAAYFSTAKDYLNASTIGHGYSIPGGLMVAVGQDGKGGNKVTLMGHGEESTRLFREAHGKGDASLNAYLRALLDGKGWICQEVTEEMTTTPDFYASEILQLKLPSLHAGRFVLVGDAGHATGPTGFGTSAALVAAYILAGEVSKSPNDIAAAPEGYEQQMRPLLKEWQKVPPFVQTIMAPQTGWGIWVRNGVFMVLAKSGLVNFVQSRLAGAFGRGEDTGLVEYGWAE